MAAAVSSAEPEKLFSYAGTLQPMDAAHVVYANGLAQVLAAFESSCTEYSVHVSHLADAMRSHGNRCDVTDGWVRTVGDKFIWADQSAVVPTPLPGDVREISPEDFWDWLDKLLETGKPIIGGLLVAMSMHSGKHAGEIVINMPDWVRTVFGISLRDARTWAGLPGHLNNIKYSNLPGSMAKFGLVASVAVIGYKWVRDFQEYEGSERVSAMITDAALVLIPVGLGWLAGAGIVALVGTGLVGGAALLAGAAIVLAGVAIGVGVNWAVDKWGLRDKSIAWVKGGLDWAGEHLDAAGDWLGETAERGMAWVDDHVFKPVSDAVAGFFAEMEDFARGFAAVMAWLHLSVVYELESIHPPDWALVSATIGATPSDASQSPVGDERPYWKQWLGDNTPLAFIPGFTPPAGGDLETIDDRLQQKFGRDVNLVDGKVKWSEYEAAAVDRAVQRLPRSLTEQSLIQNFYREDSPGSNVLAYWMQPGYTGPDGHGPCTITFYLPHKIPRQGSMSAVERAETVLFHELVHSAQFNPNGSFTALTQEYLGQFGWAADENGIWTRSQPTGPFPGTTDDYWGHSVAYPVSGQNGLEDMAEAVTYYVYEPETLKRESPERYQWIRDHIFEGQEF